MQEFTKFAVKFLYFCTVLLLLHAHGSAFEGIMLVAAVLLALEIGHLL